MGYMSKPRKATIATTSGLAAVALVIGASVAGVSAGWNPFPAAKAAPVEVVYAADASDDTFDVGTARQDAQAEKAARDAAEAAAAAAALAAQQAAEAAAAQAAADAQAAVDAAAQQSADEGGSSDDSGDSAPSPSRTRATWVDLGNGTGIWDFSNCPTGSGSTGSDGVVYCN